MDIEEETIVAVAFYAVMAILMATVMRNATRSRGKAPKIFSKPLGSTLSMLVWHVIFVAAAMILIYILPISITKSMFSRNGVVVVGTIFPIYESIHAVCTAFDGDDKTWLQYWIVQGLFSFSTEWVDDITHHLPTAGRHWFEFEFFFMLWMICPFTDGAALIYDQLMVPFVVPWVQKYTESVHGYITTAVMMAVNGSHLWVVSIVFAMMDEKFKRFVVVGIGTVYPLMASTVAVASKEGTDDTMWLTYWSCFGVLFLLMDIVEEVLGEWPGFYTACLFSTVYLMLPLFRGAEVVFRKILVPLSGQTEMLLLRDVEELRKEMVQNIPPNRRTNVLSMAANSFLRAQDINQKTE
uniref:Uncharacterized protein n=1 Tax=Attheya septentrionalis TaxID=420275 RepID=A0A7S2XRQ7_9STRA|mmetsp:Transcript_5630/g.9910  ORF Transcript_5630/g.9910 Transcript_5630/m.9910 type:complete len:352 (+) Transcript_5630:232-1287(+)|eukprot:CAMPEP_0198302908 /NCGR_PEP_ID=MMETSP1449-20131203/56608_1 /TAXON_ID=420275 /ORGANISM="Attheya septentrionalis, Strain CCMP2084" /LENGTH=351 /DNA_ID=CAMNT_0044005387 /DNA_START=221 /DNA_END=1276 /DNA_ORIENTATION=+